MTSDAVCKIVPATVGLLKIQEGTARYTDQLLAPVEVFGLQPALGGFLKERYSACFLTKIY